jgi:hypothetical protein
MKSIDQNHQQKRKFLRTLGPIILIIGLILLVIAISSFFSGFSNPGIGMMEDNKFFLAFIGMPLIFVGVAMTGAGFMGSVARYQASEMAPVAKDTVNYMVEGTKDSIKEVSKSIQEGINEGNGMMQSSDDAGLFCTQCGRQQEADARYCKYCGHKMS